MLKNILPSILPIISSREFLTLSSDPEIPGVIAFVESHTRASISIFSKSNNFSLLNPSPTIGSLSIFQSPV